MRDPRTTYKMRDLCARTGLPRQAIHFYIQQGLVPAGRKTGRNTATYDESHVERIQVIRKLQEERFLPLRAIRAVLDEGEATLTAAQRRLVSDVRAGLPAALARNEGEGTVDARAIMRRAGVDRRDFDELARLGLIATSGPKASPRLAAADAWIVELWGETRALGFSRKLGFSPALLSIFEQAVSRMFSQEKRVLGDLVGRLPPERVAEMVEGSIPLIHRFITRYHDALVRGFFTAQ